MISQCYKTGPIKVKNNIQINNNIEAMIKLSDAQLKTMDIQVIIFIEYGITVYLLTNIIIH